jgi:glutathione S-transferase
MGKNIIFCADGTWNGPGVDEDHDGAPDITNVLKLFLLLDGEFTAETILLKDEQEKRRDGPNAHVAKYLHGVGDSANPIVKLLGGAFGSGLIARVVRGYTFISRNWQPGDAIFIAGFSRGAYTARALAGMISSEGLLDAQKLRLDDKEKAYAMGTAVWSHYREHVAGRVSSPDLRTRMLQAVGDLRVVARPPFVPTEQLVKAPIRAVAVWDTVGALGLPVFDENGRRRDVFGFADRDLSPNVQYGLHAISLDEQRADFEPTLWTPRENVVQMLFAGAHADVGGGYPRTESGLSDIGLQWMMDELRQLGVQFAATPAITLAPDPFANGHTPWLEGVFAALPHRAREWPPAPNQLARHPSLEERLARAAERLAA